MRKLVFLGLLGILCFSSQSLSTRLETLMDNVVVLRVQDLDYDQVTVPISCGDAFQGQPVTWKRNGDDEPELQGNHIQVTVVEWLGGNYTCHLGPEGAPLNYTLVMIQLEPDNRTAILKERGHNQGYIHCSTPNYRGSFHCSWSRTEDRSEAAVLLVRGHRNQEIVPCEVDSNGSGMTCEDSDCPYKEEQYRITLNVYMYSESRLEGYSKAFYIRDIVTPARLPHLHLSNGNLFKWNYPESWEKPCSFFSLLFQVKVVHNGHSCDSHENILNDTTSKTQYEVSTRSKKYVFCVRAQDKHTGGPWGHWNHCIVNREIVQSSMDRDFICGL